MANEVDELMSLDPLEMTAKDIDQIILYHRNNRANHEAGIKPKKEAGPKVSLDTVMASLKPKSVVAPAQTVKRRV